jgi:beta-lactamase regulating signal transducer with metallopeptidase domain
MIVSAIALHLWQSSWFAGVAWLLALSLRHDSPRVRFWVWLAASIKFLVPFALLSWIGSQFVFMTSDEHSLLPFVQQVVAPLNQTTIVAESLDHGISQFCAVAWALGTVVLFVRWFASWRHSRTLVELSAPYADVASIPVRCSDGLAEPAVFGIRKPVLLLPNHVAATFTVEQIDSILAHEMWHVRRRDNLMAAIHRLVETVFWFHPLVWWIGAKLIDEREQACDEGVLRDGHEPQAYAETLIRVCKHSVRSRPICASSATAGDLCARIRAIMARGQRSPVAVLGRSALALALLVGVGLPVASGVTVIAASAGAIAAGTSSIRVTEAAGPAFIMVDDDYVYARDVSLRDLISRAYAVRARDIAGSIESLDQPHFDVQLKAPVGGSIDAKHLIADLLERQFNVELIVRPSLGVASARAD